MIELAREIRDCVYVSGIILKYWVYFYTTSGLIHCGTLTHSCQDSQTGCCGVFCCDGTGTPVGQPEQSVAPWYVPEQADDTEQLCSSAALVLSWLPLFPSPVLFPPTSISSSLCTPPAGLSPDPRLLLEIFLAFFLE